MCDRTRAALMLAALMLAALMFAAYGEKERDEDSDSPRLASTSRGVNMGANAF